MNKTINFFVKKEDHGKRVDIFLTKKINDLTRSHLKKLIEKNNLSINGKLILASSTKIKTKDKVCISVRNQIDKKLVPQKLNLNIIYEDKDILVIDKPKGMVVHPGAGNFDNTLANALAFKYKKNLSNLNGDLRPGIVHRLDKKTSGLLVIAKNNTSHSNLGKQFNKHSIGRKYLCLAWGVIRPLNGRIETLISRNKKNRQLMAVSEFKGKKAITNYKTLKVFFSRDIPKISLVECELETGRTHQIRVHLNYKGASLLGDEKYGKKKLIFKKINKEFKSYLDQFDGQALHATTLEFEHPTKNKRISFNSKIPEDFEKMLNFLTNECG